jgi:SNF2 family DNA or RNA helicase
MRLLYENHEITAVNEGVLQSKLLQVACGSIYTDRDGKVELPAAGRLDALKDIVESTSRKVIVFVPFIHALERVADYLRDTEEVAVVHGSTPVGQRNKIFSGFQNEERPRVIVAHPACMSHGLTLTAANTIVWYCPTNNFETYEQANARVRRPGQTAKTLIAHLVGTPIERLCYARLQDRGIFQGVLLDLFHQQELEF